MDGSAASTSPLGQRFVSRGPDNHIAILKWIEYGVDKEKIMVLSKILFYLFQDGCKHGDARNGDFWNPANWAFQAGCRSLMFL